MELVNRAYQLLFILLAFSLPLLKKGIAIIIGILFLLAIVRAVSQRGISSFVSGELRVLIFISAGFYALHLIGMLYSANIEFGLKDLEYKLSFLIFPLIFILGWGEKPDIKVMLKSFLLGYLVFMIIALVSAWQNYQDGDNYAFYYSNLSQQFHPTYHALYAAFGILSALYLAIFEKQKIPLIALASGLVVFIVLLNSKAGLLSAVLAITVALFMIFHETGKWKKTLIKAGIPAVVFLLSVNFSEATRQRIDQAVNDIENSESVQSDATEGSSTNLRLTAWKNAGEIFLKNPFGVGTGDVKDVMIESYNVGHDEVAKKKKLNTHNQFLQSSVALGWPGLVLSLLLLIWPLRVFWKRKSWLGIGFVLLMGMNLLFESMWEVQAGIVFFTFWICFLLASSRKSNDQESIKNEA